MNQKILRYRTVQTDLRTAIQRGEYKVGSLLPSEHELCAKYSITRTTARKALDELQKEGFITRLHGKGSMVIERRKSLGLLSVKGFSEAVGSSAHTRFIDEPRIVEWDFDTPFLVSPELKQGPIINFNRLRSIDEQPVMIEYNWLPAKGLESLFNHPFTEGSFFKTLSQKYFIEITGSEQEIRALNPTPEQAKLLNLPPNQPVLVINVRFSTSRTNLFIYSTLVCNTNFYPLTNAYFI